MMKPVSAAKMNWEEVTLTQRKSALPIGIEVLIGVVKSTAAPGWRRFIFANHGRQRILANLSLLHVSYLLLELLWPRTHQIIVLLLVSAMFFRSVRCSLFILAIVLHTGVRVRLRFHHMLGRYRSDRVND